jgi:hypothetical protein
MWGRVFGGLAAGAVIGAIVPWVAIAAILFLATLLFALLTWMKPFWLVVGGIGGFAVTAKEGFGAGVIGALVGLFFASVLVYGMQSAHGGADSWLQSLLNLDKFLLFALYGGGGGALIGAAVGFQEPRRLPPAVAMPTGHPRRAAPRQVNFNQTTTNFAGMTDTKTLQALNPSLGIYKCRNCSSHYHTASKNSLEDGQCYGCNGSTFDRVV